MSKSVEVLNIIASELNMPKDASLGDILATLWLMDVDGEVMSLLKKVVTDEVIEKIKKEIA